MKDEKISLEDKAEYCRKLRIWENNIGSKESKPVPPNYFNRF